MRRFALVLVAVGSVLLGVTVVVAGRPDASPARAVHLPSPLQRRLNTLVRQFRIGAAAPSTARMRPRAPRAFAVPGGSCEVAGGGCSLHPCVTYTGAGSAPAVLAAPTAVVAVPGGTRSAPHPCVPSAPAQRMVNESLVTAVPVPAAPSAP